MSRDKLNYTVVKQTIKSQLFITPSFLSLNQSSFWVNRDCSPPEDTKIQASSHGNLKSAILTCGFLCFLGREKKDQGETQSLTGTKVTHHFHLPSFLPEHDHMVIPNCHRCWKIQNKEKWYLTRVICLCQQRQLQRGEPSVEYFNNLLIASYRSQMIVEIQTLQLPEIQCLLVEILFEEYQVISFLKRRVGNPTCSHVIISNDRSFFKGRSMGFLELEGFF